jgi:hypothetical protein
MKKMMGILIAAVLVFGLANSASAALHVRGLGEITRQGAGHGGSYKLIYDDVLNVTWLDFSAEKADWVSQNGWASNLSVAFGEATFDNWRLPITDETNVTLNSVGGFQGPGPNGIYSYDHGFNLLNSELSILYEISLSNNPKINTSGNQAAVYGLVNTGPFGNLIADQYWSQTEYSPDTGDAWNFTFDGGATGNGDDRGPFDYKETELFAIALIDGDVAPVPLPGAIFLLFPALVGLFGLRHKLS